MRNSQLVTGKLGAGGWLLAAGLLLSGEGMAETLSVTRLIESIRQAHPVLLSARAKREQSEYEMMRAEGGFDTRLKQESFVRSSGYYDGTYFDQSVTKPLGIANAEVTAGYRRSSGDFPIYENYNYTLTEGEFSLGLKVSLWRNRDIDSRRAALQAAESRFLAGVSEERRQINQLVRDGVNAYLDWYQTHLQVNVIEDLVRLAEEQGRGIETRVSNGDLARISLTEFETTLLTRQVALQEARQTLMMTRQGVQFYWRDNQGDLIGIDHLTRVPEDIHWPFSDHEFDDAWSRSLIANHPAVMENLANLELARNKAMLAENDQRPDLDLKVRVAQDIGDGSQSLNGTESYVGLSFSMPLERRKAQADLLTAESRIRQLEFERKALVERLELEIQTSLQKLDAMKNMQQLRAQQATIAEKLHQQEQLRFAAGDSDQFLLNMRETAAGQSRLAAIEARIAVLRQQLGLMALTGDLGVSKLR